MMKKRILCLVLALLMLLPLVTACSKNGKKVHIVNKGASEYTIVYSEDKNATKDQEAATKLRNAIKDATDVKLELKTDWINESATEILVGKTNREATEDALKLIRAKDFIIAYDEGQVIITGGTDEATARAVDYFIENYINADKKRVTVFDGGDYVGEYAYPLGDLTVAGTPLTDYTIVYPTGADKTDKITYYIAVNLYDYILANAGVALKMVPDSTAEAECEILVGKTNRQQSKAVEATQLAADEYLLFANGKKIVMMGNSYMLGGAASAFVNKYLASKGANAPVDAVLPTAATPEKFAFEKATSAILMVGDGMGFEHVRAGVSSGLINEFVAEKLPYKSACVTASQSVLDGDAEYTDSAAAATALATGYKTINYYVGQNKNGQKVTNVRELAQSKGAKTAIVTTAAITDATPAAFLAHAGDRYDASIQTQIDKLVEEGKVDYVKGDTNDLNKVTETELINNTREALSLISEGSNTYFAMIEEAHVDKNSHKVQSGARSLADVQNSVACYNEVIAYAIGFVMLHPKTALIVTADHECGKVEYKESTDSYQFKSDNHSNADVPVFGIGDGVSELLEGKEKIDNTDIAKFIAKIYGENSFGG